MTQDEKKQAVARAALELVEPGIVLGVGTGSTTNCFIDLLGPLADRLHGAVSSSEASAERLAALGVRLLDLTDVGRIPLYVDGADEANAKLHLIKGGGGALTREKIVAAASERFVCIIDDTKRVETLGRFPLPVEVIPMARNHVASRIESLGGRPVPREGFVTDNGNVILDVHELRIDDAPGLETELDGIAGVVANGLFSRRPADLLLIGSEQGVERF
ncbi:MAG: ribose-5-phosphate isomerase RpiA [Acidobacteria bacterium]|nr:ribose-5-phosphate isomerase RpiA [Acidobacteriota bacterium]NIM63834.1 ribose-5-phosphate isomerase RpiA [Acidobacteriota bacterium]NIO59768.1 ribose-5-phosphate isomerase RpiA [Acidobacteriota bacterium]NIQ30851.1 ribose-5-phosphate isomerase RpiA [Acidobacteriota bacterium]NIQ85924.1 ribose-5-phosphate isomerase RpiA [Acidobacteriota bacterium]